MNPLCHLQKQTTFQEPVPDMVHNLRFNLDGCCSSNQNIRRQRCDFSCLSKKFPYSRKGNFWGRQKSPVHPWMKPTSAPPAKELASATLREKRKHVVLRTVHWPMELLLEAWSTGGLTKLGCIATVGCWNVFRLYNYEACFSNTLCLGGKEWVPNTKVVSCKKTRPCSLLLPT